jgi:two-component system sensor histidine kinase VanS
LNPPKIPTIGSQALLLQLSTNLVHNAIVHNQPEQGAVWSTTGAHRRSWDPRSVVLSVENTGEKLSSQVVSTLVEPFLRVTESMPTDHTGVGLGLAIVQPAGYASRCSYAPRNRTLAGDDVRVTSC